MSDAVITDTDALLEKMDHFLSTISCVSVDLGLKPKKDHQVNYIDFQDLQELRGEFLLALFGTATRYVYSNLEIENRITSFMKKMAVADAYHSLHQHAVKTFRVNNIKGQFSELLLFNLLQHHFQALPLVRKMKITTNPAMERNGADAIHVRVKDGKTTLFLGEAKTYPSGFRTAFKDSLKSIIKSYNEYRDEVNLYYHNEFLAPEVRAIAEAFIDGSLKDAQVHAVVLISYERQPLEKFEDREGLRGHILNQVKEECSKIKDSDYPEFDNFPLSRINYIILPFGELGELIKTFQAKF